MEGVRKGLLWRAGTLASLLATTYLLSQPVHAEEDIDKEVGVLDRVTVTAQKRQERLLNVPISVSAFDAHALSRKQIDQAADLQLNIPNITYTKTNFSDSNFQIRGIGLSAIGAGADSGVETHFNSVPIKTPRLFETEYFDIERVEVLRGPQGTLYGRNATGGVVNVLPKKPVKGDLSGNVELEAGNYGEWKTKGAVNIPAGDAVSMRLAGITYRRDGYTRNLFTDNDIDGRDQWSARGALRFQPADDTDATLTVNTYKEDSSRMRIGKQMCHRDPTGAYGCLPDRLGFDAANRRASLGGTLGELLPLVVPGAASVALIAPGTDLNQGALVPSDFHTVDAQFDPTYKADETIVTLEFFHDFGVLSLTALSGYQETSLISRTDYNGVVAPANYNGGGMAALFSGSIPLSQIDLHSLRGSLDNEIVGSFTRPAGYDQSDQNVRQWSQEIRLASNLARPLNFQIGTIYFDSKEENNYSIATTELDYAARLLGSQPPFYTNATPVASLKSTGIFGELYWAMSETFKWTTGLRWTQDEKRTKDRQLLLSVPVVAPLPGFRQSNVLFREFTGRFGADWKPGWFDDSMFYAFYSRGYKAGGFNPPLDRTIPGSEGTPEVYKPEFIDAIEIGSKNVFARGRAQANLSGFYYNYKGLQVSKIVARTAVNENIDADIFGFEGEFVVQPASNLQFDGNFGYLMTSIKDFSSINPRDVSNGDPNWTVVKDVSTARNYAIPTSNLASARAAGCILPENLGGPFGLVGIIPACGPAFGVIDGITTNLNGNQLPSSPKWSVSIGAQYTFEIAGGIKLTPRIDYYWRDSFYTSVFNQPIDEVAAWDVLNALIDLAPGNDSWYARGYVKNILDKDSISGMYLADASSALFTNVFALEPRTYGLAVGLKLRR